MRTLKHRCEPSAARDGLLRFAQPMATLRSPSPQRPSGSTSWIFWEHSDEMTGNILARQWHPRLGTSTDEAIRILILIVALEGSNPRPRPWQGRTVPYRALTNHHERTEETPQFY